MKFAPAIYTPYQEKQLRFLWITWVFIIALVAIDIVWVTLGGWHYNFHIINMLSGNIFALAVLLVIFHRLRLDANVLIFLHSIAQCLVLPIAGLTLSYVTASANFPLVDEKLIAFDALLGFDWKAYLEWLNTKPQLATILSWTYSSMAMQMSLALILPCVIKRLDILQHYVFCLLLTSLATIALAAIFPAVGGYIYYGIALADFSNLQPAAALLHKEHLLGLRDGSLHEIGANIQGLVTFPSFHTVVGVLLIYVAWPVGWLRFPVALLNALLILSTLGDGGHYLSDVLAGIAIAIAAIWFSRKMLPIET